MSANWEPSQSRQRTSITCFKGGLLVREDSSLVKDNLWVRAGTIINPLQLFYTERRKADFVVDCRELIISPGFIDIQINGAFGVDFSSLKEGEVEEGLSLVSQGLVQYGVTAFVPTIVTSPAHYYKRVLPLMSPRAGGKHGAAVLGIHCEGPFINSEKKGAHDETCIQSSISPALVKQVYGHHLDNLRIITVAPEVDGALDSIPWLKSEANDHGVVVAIGHSMSDLSLAEEAVCCGVSLITHLFNAMLSFHHRDPVIIGLLTSLSVKDQHVYFGLISDGYHTHDAALGIAYKSHPSGVVLVTDALAAMGLPDGAHKFGAMHVDKKDGAVRLAGKTTLAGSAATMDSCVRHFIQATSCPPGEALLAASHHPAKVLGLAETRGTLAYGAQADLVLLDANLTVQATIIGGDCVWCSPDRKLATATV